LFDAADDHGIGLHSIETGYHQLCEVIDPSFDHINRLVMKVACTWEGMQAARSLKARGIKTLATTVFGMPQAVLAGEVGCVSISPFCHELKELMDETYARHSTKVPDLPSPDC
jgi:transaldolase